MSINEDIFLLAIRGSLNKTTLDEVRNIHNETAGNPQGVAAARSLGDLSHNVFVPLGDAPTAASELLILDTWNSLDGLQKFFSDPQVQAGGNMIFKSRDPVVWKQAGFYGWSLPFSPKGKSDRFVGTIRGTVRSLDAARAAIDGLAKTTINAARQLGQISHQVFVRVTPPGQPASLEIFGVDIWQDGDGMTKFYSNPAEAKGVYDTFTAQPVTAVWKQPAGSWVEW